MQRSVSGKVRPTLSIAISTPRLSVSRQTSEEYARSLVTTTSSAPNDFRILPLDGLVVTAIGLPPRARAIWIWCTPKPPLAPVISTVSPGLIRATSFRARKLVPIGQHESAAATQPARAGPLFPLSAEPPKTPAQPPAVPPGAKPRAGQIPSRPQGHF